MKTLLLCAALACTLASATAQPAIETIKPSEADARITQFNEANAILRPAKMEGAPLALFLPGTNGFPLNTTRLVQFIAGQGYRVIDLEYVDVPAVGQVCPRDPDRDCSAKFRAMRIYGERATEGKDPVTNPEYDSIVSRLTALLHELDKRHPAEHWGAYLTADGKPDWAKILVTGLSQGAGMAAFIAKREKVLRVVCFSSPVDFTGGGAKQSFAPWLKLPSATPVDRWYLVRNSREPLGPLLVQSYPLLGVPADHIFVFTRDLPRGVDPKGGEAYHGAGIKDPGYAPEWQVLFGKASDVLTAGG